MVNTEHYHHHAHGSQYYHPRLSVSRQYSNAVGCARRIHLDEISRQINQTACCYNLGNVIESSLPTDVFSLVGCRQLAHVYTVARNIVGSSTKGDDRQQANGYTKEMRELQRKGNQPESDTRYKLGSYHKEFLGLE